VEIIFIYFLHPDIVVWDSHPLMLGATPQQVYVDGIAQLSNPYPLEKPAAFQDLPETPNWDREKNDTVYWDGLPPLTGWKIGGHKGRVRLLNVKNLVGFNELSNYDELETVFDDTEKEQGRVVVIEDGRITCVQRSVDPCTSAFGGDDEVVIDLRGGSIEPGLTTYGSPLGLVEIRLEASTNDGNVLDPLIGGDLPSILAEGSERGLVRAADGLFFQGRNTL
jgi:hypothetical protein